MLSGQRHQHCRQSLVAGRNTHDALARGQRANQAAQDDRGVIAVGKAVHHTQRALGAPVTWICDEAGKGNGPPLLEFLRGGLHQEPNFPVPCVIPQCDGAYRRARGCRPGY